MTKVFKSTDTVEKWGRVGYSARDRYANEGSKKSDFTSPEPSAIANDAGDAAKSKDK